jgi:hypothetical protein
LKEVTRDFEAAGFPSDRLYEAVQVPVARRERVRLLESGRNFARRMRKALNLPASTVDLFLQELERTYASQQVDFGNLDLAAQQSVIEQAAADPEFLRALRDLNPRIPEPVEMEISFSHRIRHLFGPEAHAASLDRCFRSLFESEPPAEPAADAIGPALLTEFFTPRAQRPLYGGW